MCVVEEYGVQPEGGRHPREEALKENLETSTRDMLDPNVGLGLEP